MDQKPPERRSRLSEKFFSLVPKRENTESESKLTRKEMKSISQSINALVPDGSGLNSTIAERIPDQEIEKLRQFLYSLLDRAVNRHPKDKKLPLVIELSRDDEEVKKSLFRCAQVMRSIPEISQLLDIYLASSKRLIPDEDLPAELDRIRQQLAQKMKVEFQFHSGQREGFNNQFLPDPESHNHAKVKKESDGTWVIITNEVSNNDPLELAHEIYGHLFERWKLPSDYDSDEEYLKAKAYEYLDTKVFDTLFLIGNDLGQLIDGETILGDVRKNLA